MRRSKKNSSPVPATFEALVRGKKILDVAETLDRLTLTLEDGTAVHFLGNATFYDGCWWVANWQYPNWEPPTYKGA